MSRRPRGFDPLSSLFEKPIEDPAAPEAQDSSERYLDPSSLHAFSHVVDVTDPFFSSPPSPEKASHKAGDFNAGNGVPQTLFVTTADENQSGPNEVPGTDSSSTEVSTDKEAPPAQKLDPRTLAVALGKAAASAAANAPPSIPSDARGRAHPMTDIQGADKALPPESRLDELSRRAVRPGSAREIIRHALEQEQREQERAARIRRESANRSLQPDGASTAPNRHSPLVAESTEIIEKALKGLGPIQVSNCMAVKDREILRALWKAHRARFAADGKLEQVVAAGAVLIALKLVPEGKLLAAHVLTQASDYLVWLDLDQGIPLAAFADAKAYFVHRM